MALNNKEAELGLLRLVKSSFPVTCGQPAPGQRDPVKLFCSLGLAEKCGVGIRGNMCQS